MWCTEHHTLTEYSHLSASESFIAYALAQTERIHVGSGIFPLNPITNHPVRIAERVAMLDHLSEGRFEFGSGRGAGSHELGTFNVDPGDTKANWDEVIWEFTKMWDSFAYSHDGPVFSTPPRNVVPKPYGGGRTHPPMWVAAGNPPTYEKAARHGLGVLGFNVAARYEGRTPRECLAFGVACGAESTQHFGAGNLNPHEVERTLPRVEVRELDVPAEVG